MKIQKYYLAIGALVCSAILGAVFTSQLTYAADVNHNTAIQVVDGYEAELEIYFETNYPEATISYNKQEATYGLYYKPDSVNAYVELPWGYALDVRWDITDVTPNDTILTNFLTENGFQEYAEQLGSYPSVTVYLNPDTNILCSYIKDSGLTGISCGYTGDLQISTDWQSFLNAIGTAYYASQNIVPTIGYESSVYVSDSVSNFIQNSDYSPYQYTLVPIGNFIGLFYRQNPTSDWVYFTGTQAPIDCSEFTGEVQKGFAGYVCYNGDQESRVAVATEVADETPTEDSASSGTKTPNTGIFTSGDQNSIVATSIVAISTIGIVVYISRYIINRQKSKVYFDKN